MSRSAPRAEIGALRRAVRAAPGAVSFLVLELAPGLRAAEVEPSLAPSGARRIVLLRRFGAGEGAALDGMGRGSRAGRGNFIAVDASPRTSRALPAPSRPLGDDRLIVTCSGVPAPATDHPVGAYRRIAEALRRAGIRAPVWIRNTAGTAVRGDNSFLSRLIEASFLTGSLLCDGVGDLVSIETESDAARAPRGSPTTSSRARARGFRRPSSSPARAAAARSSTCRRPRRGSARRPRT